MQNKSKKTKSVVNTGVAIRVRLPLDKNVKPALYRLLCKVPADRQGAVLLELANFGLMMELMSTQVSGLEQHIKKIKSGLLASANASVNAIQDAATSDAAAAKEPGGRAAKSKSAKPVAKKADPVAMHSEAVSALMDLTAEGGIGLD